MPDEHPPTFSNLSTPPSGCFFRTSKFAAIEARERSRDCHLNRDRDAPDMILYQPPVGR